MHKSRLSQAGYSSIQNHRAPLYNLAATEFLLKYTLYIEHTLSV